MPYYKVEILLPITNNEGERYPEEMFELTGQELSERFGGLTLCPYEFTGIWFEPFSLQKYIDKHSLYFVVIEGTEQNVLFLRDILKNRLLARFRQKDIFITATPVEIW